MIKPLYEVGVKYCFLQIPSQFIDPDGTSYYERGCMATVSVINYEDGCFGGSNLGVVCYKKCTGEKCNDHKNLNSSAASITVGLLGALIYSMF